MPFTRSEFLERIEALQRHLVDVKVDLAVLNRNSDIYYYTGSMQPLYLFVPADGEPITLARKAINRIPDEVPHIKLEPFYGGKDLSAIASKYGLTSDKVKRVGYALDTIAYSTVTRFQKLFVGIEVADLSWDLRALRLVKSEAEIAVMAKAGEVMARVPDVVRNGFRPGMTEVELSAVIENYFRLNGHIGMVRCRREGIEVPGFGVCSSGTNSLAGTKFDGICSGMGTSPATPFGASNDPIRKGDPVILDYAFNLEGYHVDQTRMFSWGKPSDQILKAYEAMVKVESAIFEALKPGRTWESVYNEAVELANELGYSEEFMGLGTEKVRFVGHGVGLELDEPPLLAPQMEYTLAEGMIVAIEPKVALPGIGIIGPEDTVVIRSNSIERLTTCTNDFIIVD